MSLLTIRVPVLSGSALDVRLLSAVTDDDRPRVAAATRVRSLRVISTEPDDRAPFLKSVFIERWGEPPVEGIETHVATIRNQVRPDQPKLNVVDCSVPESVALGGNVDWALHSAEKAPSVGAVLTFLVTLDD